MTLRTAFPTLLLAALMAMLAGTRAAADLFVNMLAITVEGDGVTATQGVLEVRLGVTGDAPDISSYNLRFESVNPAVTFGTPTPVMTSPLFDPGISAFDSMSTDESHTVLIMHDLASVMGDPFALAFNGAGLVRLPFTVAAGALGTFAINLTEVNSEFGIYPGNAIGVTPNTGSITVIAAVPEASAAALLATVATLAAAVGLVVKHWRRRHAQPPTSPC